MGDITIVTPEAAAAALAVIVGAAAGAWQGWRAQRAASRAADQATLAAKRAGTAAGAAQRVEGKVEPVSNGFAGQVLDGQARLEDQLTRLADHLLRVEGKVDQHLVDHAAADVRRAT